MKKFKNQCKKFKNQWKKLKNQWKKLNLGPYGAHQVEKSMKKV